VLAALLIIYSIIRYKEMLDVVIDVTFNKRQRNYRRICRIIIPVKKMFNKKSRALKKILIDYVIN
jgi:hypothetical protein